MAQLVTCSGRGDKWIPKPSKQASHRPRHSHRRLCIRISSSGNSGLWRRLVHIGTQTNTLMKGYSAIQCGLRQLTPEVHTPINFPGRKDFICARLSREVCLWESFCVGVWALVVFTDIQIYKFIYFNNWGKRWKNDKPRLCHKPQLQYCIHHTWLGCIYLIIKVTIMSVAIGMTKRVSQLRWQVATLPKEHKGESRRRSQCSNVV